MNSHFFEILKREMVLALGCTEPVALAWAGAVVKKHLGAEPKRMVARCSPNIIKNVKSVIVPNTNGMKGIDVACVVGACFGDAESGLETLATMNEDKIARCAEKVAQIPCQIEILETNATLHFIIEGYYQDEVVGVEIKDEHTRIVQITRNGNVLQKAQERRQKHGGDGVEVGYSVKEIINFARTVDYSPLQTLLRRSIECNLAIAREGLQKDYGINVGKTILSMNDGGVRSEAKSYAAAASDARMSGCSLPVMINSGSGNQGITVSIPVIMYARHVNASEESLYRALILSNLIALYEKFWIGKLSAYCGVVCASSGAAAGITWLSQGSDEQIEYAVINTLGTLSGMICDGAKASCAAKIATGVDTAFTCVDMALRNQCMSAGDGIIKDGLDDTVMSVGRLASSGMRTTDEVILKIMLDQ